MEKKKYSFLLKLVINIVVGLALVGLFLLYSQNTSLIGVIDAFSASSVLLFAFGWFVIAHNHNVFDILVYGVGQFLGAIFNRRPDVSYPEYLERKKRMPSTLYLYPWLAALLQVFVLIILFLKYKNVF